MKNHLPHGAEYQRQGVGSVAPILLGIIGVDVGNRFRQQVGTGVSEPAERNMMFASHAGYSLATRQGYQTRASGLSAGRSTLGTGGVLAADNGRTLARSQESRGDSQNPK